MKRRGSKKVKKRKFTRFLKKLAKKLEKPLQAQVTITMDLIHHTVVPLLDNDDPDKTDKINSRLDKIKDVVVPAFLKIGKSILEENFSEVIDKITLSYKQDGFSILHHSSRTQDVLDALLENNLSLITTIPDYLLQRSRTVLLQAVGGFDRGSLVRELKSITDLSDRRVELIARDQTAKAVTAYDRSLAKDIGFTHYIWSTSDDERVSTGEGGHKYLDNRIYSLDNPTAIIDDKKTRGHPGQRINCRCTQLPLYLNQGESLTMIKDAKRGDYYVITKTK